MISETVPDSLLSIIRNDNNYLSLNHERFVISKMLVLKSKIIFHTKTFLTLFNRFVVFRLLPKSHSSDVHQFHRTNSQHSNQSAFSNFSSPLISAHSLTNLSSISSDINSSFSQQSAFTPTKAFSQSVSNGFIVSSSTSLSPVEADTTVVLSSNNTNINSNNNTTRESTFHFLNNLRTDFSTLSSNSVAPLPLNKENYQSIQNDLTQCSRKRSLFVIFFN